MVFRLALALGKTIAELGAAMTYQEFVWWCEFYALEPWGDQRADLRAGIIASTVANANRGKDTQTFQPIDFMPYAREACSAQTPEHEQELDPDEVADLLDAALFGIVKPA